MLSKESGEPEEAATVLGVPLVRFPLHTSCRGRKAMHPQSFNSAFSFFNLAKIESSRLWLGLLNKCFKLPPPHTLPAPGEQAILWTLVWDWVWL